MKKAKLIKGIVGAAITVGPVVSDWTNEKLKQKTEKIKQEKIYIDQKHNGMVKFASIFFSLVALFLSVYALKQSKIILGIIGLLALIAYAITFLYCLEIINEKKHNTYKVVFIIGDMLMVVVATLLFF